MDRDCKNWLSSLTPEQLAEHGLCRQVSVEEMKERCAAAGLAAGVYGYSDCLTLAQALGLIRPEPGQEEPMDPWEAFQRNFEYLTGDPQWGIGDVLLVARRHLTAKPSREEVENALWNVSVGVDVSAIIGALSGLIEWREEEP